MGAVRRHIVTTGDSQAVDATILNAFSYLDILLKEAKTEYAKVAMSETSCRGGGFVRRSKAGSPVGKYRKHKLIQSQ